MGACTSNSPADLDRDEISGERNIFREISQDVIEACPINGLMIKENTKKGTPQYINAPMTLFPTPYPVDMYKKAIAYQEPMGEVVAGVVRNPEKHIHELLSDFSKKDDFMAMLMKISRSFND